MRKLAVPAAAATTVLVGALIASSAPTATSRPGTTALPDPICVQTDPLYVLGHEVLPATNHCVPV